MQCRECGEVEQCENCAISLTYHRVTQRIVCHHCRHEAPAPERCTRCGSHDLSFRGLGTEQVERLAAEAFPTARIARMDVDTTSGKWAHQKILDRVGRGEFDILLGTQMIAKGLDFPFVSFVGVLHADAEALGADFRAQERLFQLITQTAGRAGRDRTGGEVVVQTTTPDLPALRFALQHDYESFAAEELSGRRAAGLPPPTSHPCLSFHRIDRPTASTAGRRHGGYRRMARDQPQLLLGQTFCRFCHAQ